MSSIKIWTSTGKWSKEVVGLDKIDLMERALHMGKPDTMVYDEYDDIIEEDVLDGFAYNGDQPIYCKYYKDEDKWEICPLRFEDIQSFQMPFQILEALKKDTEYPYLSAVYDELIKAAEIPAGLKVKSVMLKFHD